MNVNTSQNDTGVVFGDFKSCKVVREENNDVISLVTLLPLKYAKVGKQLELQDNGVWKTWLVLSASEFIVKDPTDPRILIKSQRTATGDSMPKRAK